MSSIEWDHKGCEKCREGLLSGNPPPEIGVSDERWATLHKCQYCGSYWEIFLRNADIANEETIKRFYPEVYKREFQDS